MLVHCIPIAPSYPQCHMHIFSWISQDMFSSILWDLTKILNYHHFFPSSLIWNKYKTIAKIVQWKKNHLYQKHISLKKSNQHNIKNLKHVNVFSKNIACSFYMLLSMTSSIVTIQQHHLPPPMHTKTQKLTNINTSPRFLSHQANTCLAFHHT
jgi:hypothetical protein